MTRLRNGFLVAEGYFGDGSRTRLNDVRFVRFLPQGWGGQYIYVLPQARVVVVMTADLARKDRHIHFGPVETLIERFLLESVGT